MATVTINIQAEPNNSYYTIQLGYSTTGDDVCYNEFSGYQVDSNPASLATATKLYKLDNSLAETGWYSDGTKKRFWNKTTQVLDAWSGCSSGNITISSHGIVTETNIVNLFYTVNGFSPTSLTVQYKFDNGQWINNTGGVQVPRTAPYDSSKDAIYRITTPNGIIVSNEISIPKLTSQNVTLFLNETSFTDEGTPNFSMETYRRIDFVPPLANGTSYRLQGLANLSAYKVGIPETSAGASFSLYKNGTKILFGTVSTGTGTTNNEVPVDITVLKTDVITMDLTTFARQPMDGGLSAFCDFAINSVSIVGGQAGTIVIAEGSEFIDVQVATE